MITKLKLKFIFTNMALITVVVITAFALLYFSSEKDLEQSSITAMHDIAKRDFRDSEHMLKPEDRIPNSTPSYLSAFVIQLDERNNTFFIEGYEEIEYLDNADNEYINTLINCVISRPATEGVLEEYNLRYYCISSQDKKRIVFLDKSYEDENLKQLLISFLLSGTIAFVSFLIISIIVANIAVKPVETSICQQHQLVSDLSHELKTPIAVVSANADILLSHNDSNISNEIKWINYIKDETQRMSNLVNMMLYLAKTDESDNKPELKSFDLSNAAYEIALPFESVCFESGKNFNIDIQPERFIKGDEASLKQLLLILLDNALKYSNENGQITLSVQSLSDCITMSVFNTGEPIPKESIPHLFERFYRVDKARSRENGGNGLGLSIAKRIIEYNEANISVISNSEHGTTFICSFKTAKQNKSKEKPQKDYNQFT